MSNAGQEIFVRGEVELSTFRRENAGSEILALLKRNNVLINWPVGVGKSHNLDDVIDAAVGGDDYDTVVALLPTREVINERRLIKSPSANGRKVIDLKPRPSELCGPTNDRQWCHFETRGLGQLARESICKHCTNNEQCFWINQYGKALVGADVIYAAQSHLKNDPDFIRRITEQCGASRPLVIFDEAVVSLTAFGRTVSHNELSQFKQLIQDDNRWSSSQNQRDWLFYLEVLITTRTSDLQTSNHWKPPFMEPDNMIRIQRNGFDSFGEDYRYIGQDLVAFGGSSLDSREKSEQGDLLFSAPPLLDFKVLLYSGTTDPKILEMRLGVPFHNPYEHARFKILGTTWINIASSIGTSSYFRKNADQILDFFAELISLRLHRGLSVLLISKKKHAAYCAQHLNTILARNDHKDVQVVHGSQLNGFNSKEIPLIHYGVIGTNKYEAFDSVFCLNGYYISDTILSDSIQDLRASNGRINVEISSSGQPKRRFAKVSDSRHRYTDVAGIAQPMLTALEMGSVVQAVGRVRPFTKAREVITFQNGEFPQAIYDHEFNSLPAIRAHFGIQNRRARNKTDQATEIQRLKRGGLTQAAVAEKLAVSTRTVGRYWRTEVDTNPI